MIIDNIGSMNFGHVLVILLPKNWKFMKVLFVITINISKWRWITVIVHNIPNACLENGSIRFVFKNTFTQAHMK